MPCAYHVYLVVSIVAALSMADPPPGDGAMRQEKKRVSSRDRRKAAATAANPAKVLPPPEQPVDRPPARSGQLRVAPDGAGRAPRDAIPVSTKAAPPRAPTATELRAAVAAEPLAQPRRDADGAGRPRGARHEDPRALEPRPRGDAPAFPGGAVAGPASTAAVAAGPADRFVRLLQPAAASREDFERLQRSHDALAAEVAAERAAREELAAHVALLESQLRSVTAAVAQQQQAAALRDAASAGAAEHARLMAELRRERQDRAAAAAARSGADADR